MENKNNEKEVERIRIIEEKETERMKTIQENEQMENKLNQILKGSLRIDNLNKIRRWK